MAVERPFVTKVSGAASPWTTQILLKHIHDQLTNPLSPYPWIVTNATGSNTGEDSFTAAPPAYLSKDWEVNFTWDDSGSTTSFQIALAPEGGITGSAFPGATVGAGTPLSAEGICDPASATFEASTSGEVLCLIYSDMIMLLFQDAANTMFPAICMLGQVVNIWSSEMAASPHFIDGLGYFYGKSSMDRNSNSSQNFIAWQAQGDARRQLRIGENVWIGDAAGDVQIPNSAHSTAGEPDTINNKYFMMPVILTVEGYTSAGQHFGDGYYSPIGLLNHLALGRTANHTDFTAKDRMYASDGAEWLFVYQTAANCPYGAADQYNMGFFVAWDENETP